MASLFEFSQAAGIPMLGMPTMDCSGMLPSALSPLHCKGCACFYFSRQS